MKNVKRLCDKDVNDYVNVHKCSYSQAFTILEKKNVNLPLNLHEQETDKFEYNEAEHPRDESGKWTSGAGGGGETNGGNKELKIGQRVKTRFGEKKKIVAISEGGKQVMLEGESNKWHHPSNLFEINEGK